MQIRLTVLGPRGGHALRACDVLVTAPAGTALAAVAGGLAAAVAAASPGSSGAEPTAGSSGSVVLYAGAERLDAQRSVLGEPPLTDGAVLSLHAPAEPGRHPGVPHDAPSDASAQLHVVAGPDSGGVHLLQGGQIRIGRSADADVPLDDPDVSRLHCAVTVAEDGRVAVADLGSTNGTTLSGTPIGARPAPLRPGALLRLGESALRLVPGPRGATGVGSMGMGRSPLPPALPTAPDGEGHLRVTLAPTPDDEGDLRLVPAATPGSPAAPAPVAETTTTPGPAPASLAPTPMDGSHRAQDAHARQSPPGGENPQGARPHPAVPRGETPVRAGPHRPSWAIDPHAPSGGEHPAGPTTGAVTGTSLPFTAPGDRGEPGGHEPRKARSLGAETDATAAADPVHHSSPDTGAHADPPRRVPQAGGGSAANRVQARALPTDTHDFDSPRPAAASPPADRHAEPGWTDGTGAPPPARDNGPHATGRATPDGTLGSTGVVPGGDAAQGPSSQQAASGGPGTDETGAHGEPAPYAAGGAGHTDAEAPAGPRGPMAGLHHDQRTRAAELRRRADGTHTGQRRLPGLGHAEGTIPEPRDPRAAGTAGEARPRPARIGRGIGAWARRLAGGRGAADGEYDPVDDEPSGAERTPAESVAPERWPDPAEVLLTALGPGPRLWERRPGHPDALAVRLGTADRPGGPAHPLTVGLRDVGSLGLAGPRVRLAGLTRSVVAQLAALHSPTDLEIVLISTDRTRDAAERLAEWSWLGWLPHLRPGHGQDCRLLLAYDREQAASRTAELVRRLDDGPLGAGWVTADRATVSAAAQRYDGPYTLVIVDGDPGSAALRGTTARLAAGGPAAGIHLLCLAETPAASPSSPLASTFEAARAAPPPLSECGAAALLSGDVATALRLLPLGPAGPLNNGAVATVDAVSAAWAERFARALAPLRAAQTADGTAANGRPPGSAGGVPTWRPAVPLPRTARLLDELGLSRATPASLLARWAAAEDAGGAEGGRTSAVLGAGPHGALSVDVAADGPHLLIEGGRGTGKTELLRSLAASLAAADRPDRVALALVDGGGDGARSSLPEPSGPRPAEPHGEHGGGLQMCTDLPHVSTYLTAADPLRMREFSQALGTELKRRAELLGDLDFADWHRQRTVASRLVAPRRPGAYPAADRQGDPESVLGFPIPVGVPPAKPGGARGGSVKLRARSSGRTAEDCEPAPGDGAAGGAAHLPRLLVLVDDFDELVAPALGSPGRPAAGSVVRALETVAREGARLGVHLIAATGRPDHTARTAAAEHAGLRITLDVLPARTDGPEAGEASAGRGRLLRRGDDSVTWFQAGRVTGRIPRTATLRPTVVPLEWERMGDPPTRRPLRELGNGPTDLALLASALQRAASQSSTPPAPSLLP
ncbi:FHA domain-containing protein [Streptomyces sp. KR80]|uniref:FHA domain-containing protein n=1 Tax=Streptomyces sp. KR80 TaxID=3457426 RepID=UPI003FD39642